jgi:class 3 adenylate cyclase
MWSGKPIALKVEGVSLQDLPSGIVTFVFTDIDGSTQLWERYPDQTRSLLTRHDQVIEDIVSQPWAT